MTYCPTRHIYLTDDKVFLMPDGSPHIAPNTLFFNSAKKMAIHTSITSCDRLVELCCVLDEAVRSDRVVEDIYIYYLIGSRQDKNEPETSVTLEVVANILKPFLDSANVKRVHILHHHSVSTENVFGARFREIDHTKFVREAIEDFDPDFLIIPDAGASRNAKKYDIFNIPQVQCLKIRDPKTGNLSGFKIVDTEFPGYRGMIVDDCIDGGGTFIGLAKEFQKLGEVSGNMIELGLYTTHGIYSKGVKTLEKYFQKMYCTNSYPHNQTSVTTFEI